MREMPAALTSKNNYQIKTSLFSRICEIIRVVTKLFLRKPERREVFPAKTKEKITRKETREHLAQFNLACELVKVIRHFFPDLIPLLKRVEDPRHQSYILYSNHVLLMIRILSSIFYINSMRSTSAEFNNETVIENIGILCGEELEELPYWETINDYLKRFSSDELQKVVWRLVYRLIRSRAFEDARIRGKYWQVIIDGTQLYRSRKDLGKHSLFCRKKKGTEEEYIEYYHYVLEAKIVLHEKIQVSILTEFIENDNREVDKQDCEQKGAKRLMERLKQEFPMLQICICGDSLYASEGFFKECRRKKWKYILRYKEGSIPSINQEYQVLKIREKNRMEEAGGVYDYVTGIDYRGESINVVEYEDLEEKKKFLFVTDLSITGRNVKGTVERGRWRWKIENEGFNTQKNQGYHLEHRFSHDYQGMKNHYYLIQIGHMIAQIIEAWEMLWKKVKQSREQKHRLLLTAWKNRGLKESLRELEKKIQVRFA